MNNNNEELLTITITGVPANLKINSQHKNKPRGWQDTASKAEQAARKSAMKTQGRKGCKAFRIHTAYNPENYKYIKLIAAANGVTLTKVVNAIIDEYRKQHPEIGINYAKVKDMLDVDLKPDFED